MASGYLTEPKAGDYLSLHKDTLRKFRREGGGPKYVRMGRAIRYSIESLDAWAKSNTYGSRAEEMSRG